MTMSSIEPIYGPGIHSEDEELAKGIASTSDSLTSDSWRASSATIRRVMRSNRGRDTGPELRLRRKLHSMGLRFRVGLRIAENRRRSIDIAFTRQRIAIFVDGCFWHGCPVHSRATKSNSEFWRDKIRRNQSRDVDTNALLEAGGWTVLRYWEHEDFESAAQQIYEAVRGANPTRVQWSCRGR